MRALVFRRRSLSAVLGLLALAHEARATLYVASSDRALTRRADLVVAGRVRAVETVATSDGGVRTRITLDVDAQYKGRRRHRLVVEQPGGSLPGRALWIEGAPAFRPGERHLLFLTESDDGTMRTVALGLGHYTLRSRPDGEVFAERILGAPVVGGAAVRRQRLARLLRTIERAVATAPAATGAPRPGRRAAPRGRIVERMSVGAFTFMDRPGGRWREPDLGEPVVIDVDAGGDAGLGIEASLAAVDAAMAAWSGVRGATIELARGGAAQPIPMLCDGFSQILFNDPFWEMPNPHDCSGVLAMGGYCTAGSDVDLIDGVQFRRIVEGNVTFSNGFARCPFWTAENVAEIMTHELGHLIGIGHSSEDDDEPSPALKDATMYYRAHFDGRAASVRPDDVAAARAIYPGDEEPDGDVDRDGVADAGDNCPGSDPALGVPNPAQTDLDLDGMGDVCDPCPLAAEASCGRLLGSTVRVRARGSGALSWSAVLESPLADVQSALARVVLVSGDGVLLDGHATAGGPGRGRGAGQRFGRRQVFRSTTARLAIGRDARHGIRLRLKVRPFAAPAAHPPSLRVNLQLGASSYSAPLICRPSTRWALACTS